MKAQILILFILLSVKSFGQINDPVHWKGELKKIDTKDLLIKITARMDSGWHIYSRHLPQGGPVSTSLSFPQLKDFSTDWNESGNPVTEFDSANNIHITWYADSVSFYSRIPVTLVTGKKNLDITVNYMACTHQICLPPTDKDILLDTDPINSLSLASNKDLTYITNAISKNENRPGDHNKLSGWAIFFTAFLGGLAALLTPCVFPMIPMTVSYFTKQSRERKTGIKNAIIYSLSIIIIYVALGLLISLIFGVDALNAMATNVWFNIIFFIILVLFAASFLGAFEITLPSAFVNKIDRQSDRGGLIGIFFMAFTLALVSFSCTGPIVGTLLFESAVSGNIRGPLIGMLGFSSAMALPFGLFAAFPGWLNSLPKSGGWLNSVKVVLGLLELALAFKFLSNADLVVQAGIITREVFLVIWISIFGLMTLYLWGIIKFSHDETGPVKLSVPRAFFSMVVFAFTLYLIPGLWGAPLKLISGFPPPDFYSEWNHRNTETAESVVKPVSVTDQNTHCPNELNCFHDYDKAKDYAEKVNKPLMVDFTGWACVNCRKMEGNVWTDPRVDDILRNKVVLVSLYVDDKRALPESEQTTEELGGKSYKIKTIGNQWSFLQAEKFRINSQPFYVIENGAGKPLSVSEGYNPSVSDYLNFLQKGISAYYNKNS